MVYIPLSRIRIPSEFLVHRKKCIKCLVSSDYKKKKYYIVISLWLSYRKQKRLYDECVYVRSRSEKRVKNEENNKYFQG